MNRYEPIHLDKNNRIPHGFWEKLQHVLLSILAWMLGWYAILPLKIQGRFHLWKNDEKLYRFVARLTCRYTILGRLERMDEYEVYKILSEAVNDLD